MHSLCAEHIIPMGSTAGNDARDEKFFAFLILCRIDAVYATVADAIDANFVTRGDSSKTDIYNYE